MSWQDRKQKASFRGVAFNVDISDLEIGRRVAFYDLPLDESGGSMARDMGALSRKHALTAVYCGPNYDLLRNNLIAALEKAGPGELVHPYYGRVQVVIDGPAHVRESTADGGTARIEFTFRKHRDQGTPLMGLDTFSDVINAADLALAALNEDYVGSFSVAGVEGWVHELNLDALENLTDDIQKINNDIDRLLAIPSKLASDLDEFSKELAELINTPQKLINSVQALIASVLNSIDRVADAIGALLPTSKKAAVIGLGIEPIISILTPSRTRQRVNQYASVRAFRGCMIANTAKVAAGLTYSSTQEAISVRNTLIEQFNAFAESDEMDSQEAIDDSVDPANLVSADGPQIDKVQEQMRALRVALNRHLLQIVGDLPSMVFYIPAETIPAIVIAYQLYRDASRDLEIVDRNLEIIRYPLFVPGSQRLEVIANV